MKSRGDCDCLCHSGGIVLHVVPCCDGIASLLPRKADSEPKESGNTHPRKIKLIHRRLSAPSLRRLLDVPAKRG
jgi:hypothetical protein